MAVRISCVLMLCFAVAVLTQDSLENAGLRIALKVFDECSKSDGLSPCLKKKALTFLDRVGRLDKLQVTDEISIVKASNDTNSEPSINEEQLEKNLPRNVDARDEVLNDMLWSKVTSLVQGRNLEFSMPRLSDIDFEEEGRKGSLLGKKKFKLGKKKGGGMLMGMMMGIMGKMMALIPLGIAGLFLLAGKALITSKIALLLSGIIAIKKLIAAKQGDHGDIGGHGHGGHHHIVSSGGGWDKRSMDESQKLAYSASAPK